MFTKITKNLIIFSFIIFSFALANIASADSTVYAFSRSGSKFNIAAAEDMGYATNFNKPVSTSYTTNQLSSSNNEQTSTSVNNNTTTKTTSNSNTTSKTANVAVAKNTTNSQVASNVTPAKELNNGSTGSSYSYSDRLGASAFGSVKTTNSSNFMPSTFWGWLLVVLLILAIVILYRMIARKAKEEKTA